MRKSFSDGYIVAEGALWEKAHYDVGNRLITAQFDGCGNISRYAVMNKFEIFDCYYSLLSINGKPLTFTEEKTVKMKGRTQVTTIKTAAADIEITQFLSEKENAVMTELAVTAKEDVAVINTVNFGVNYTSYLEKFITARLSLANFLRLIFKLACKHKRTVADGDVFTLRNDILGDFYLDFACDAKLTPQESNFFFVNQFSASLSATAGERKCLRYAVSAGTRKTHLGKTEFSFTDAAACVRDFDSLKKQADAYVLALTAPESATTERQKAFYSGCLNTALANYKEIGEFKGFLAGIVYQFPARTYFRDGYWTVLSVLPVRPDLVRNELLTLSKGIGKNGECPSAVKCNFRNWWGNHYDSPSFFVLMLYDYVAHTGDFSILQEKTKSDSVLLSAKSVMDRLSKEADASGLLVKGGAYNRRDWCDNVFRSGYVTYDEALFIRALRCLGELLEASGENGEAYLAAADKAQRAMNELLWDEEKGYFVNYRGDDGVEDNLSIDTLVVPLFGLTTEERARRTLANMERLLESKNNSEQGAGDFGVLSVYPFYKNNSAVVLKSSLPYYYHNGGDWPYLSAAYAYAKLSYGMDYEYPLTRWFDYNVDKGNYTPVEFFSPFHKDGSMLQAWSSVGAFVMSYPKGDFYKKKLPSKGENR